MNTEQMNVHKALAEVKMLNNKINKEINAIKFCTSNVVTNDKIAGKSIVDWKADVKSQYDSITALIKRRNAIKCAINQSNAQATITVDDTTYTIAEALEMKEYGIDYYQQLISKLSTDFMSANNKVDNINADADTKATQYAQQLVTGDKNSPEVVAKVDEMRQMYLKSHKAELLDPIDATAKVTELEEFVNKFKTEVDSAISVSNATTIIKVEY